jgi:hypothetical protein
MALVFQNTKILTPHPLSARRVCTPRLCWGGGRGEDTLAGQRGGWGVNIWKTRDIGLPTYSNNLSTVCTVQCSALVQYCSMCWEERGRGPADRYLGTIMTIVYCDNRSMKTDIYRSCILCTVYGALDFLIVPYRNLYG